MTYVWVSICVASVIVVVFSDLLDGVFDFLPDDIISITAVGLAAFSGCMAGGVSLHLAGAVGIFFALLMLIVSSVIRSHADAETQSVSIRVGDKGVIKGAYHSGDNYFGEAVFTVNGIKIVRNITINGLSEDEELPQPGELVVATQIGETITVELPFIENVTKERK